MLAANALVANARSVKAVLENMVSRRKLMSFGLRGICYLRTTSNFERSYWLFVVIQILE
jgi:hypothetical protein